MAFIFVVFSVMTALYENSGNPIFYNLLSEYWGPDIRYPINIYGSNSTLAPAGVFILSFFIIATGILVMNEASRLSPKLHFPFSKLASFFLREKEYNAFASYIYFTIGMIFSALLMTTLPILAILATLSFGDSSYALIGKRIGKHKIPFNKIKSIEGSIGGFLVTLICTWPIVGFAYALLAAGIFTAIDVITPRIPICDNIGGPIFITIGFYILAFTGLPLGGIIVLFF